MKAMFGPIRIEMDLQSEICLNLARPKTENGFWPANFMFVQCRQFFSLKISQFWSFETLQDEIGNYFLD